MKDIKAADCIVQLARSWLGTPYRHQASLKGVGCDCIGLVRGVWREFEGKEPVAMPFYSSAWSEVSGRELLLDAVFKYFCELNVDRAAPGDVVVFRLRARSAAKHIGILSDRKRFIHAYHGNAVVENSLSEFWRSRIAGYFRFPGVAQEGSN